MGLVQRDGIHRLRHAKRYSGQFDTICTNPAWTGFTPASGRLLGPDPREMAKSDCVVIWGTNAVATQVNVMTHAVRGAQGARRQDRRSIDVYRNETMKQADIGLCLKPGTDAALACAVMHVLFRDGHADRDYLAKYTDVPEELEAHLRTRTPEWAAAITGLPVAEIEAFARAVGTTKRTFFRLGYGFTRSRNGAGHMHAASCIAAVTGAWQYEGGGAFHSNSAIFGLDKAMVEGHDLVDPNDPPARPVADRRRSCAAKPEALFGGPPVTAMLIQNTNPVSVAPEQAKVKRGFAARRSLRLRPRAVDDRDRGDGRYRAAGDDVPRARRHLSRRRPPVHHPRAEADRPAGRRPRPTTRSSTNWPSDSASHIPGFGMTEREHIDWMLRKSNRGTLAELEAAKWIDCQPDFRTSHYLDGFASSGRQVPLQAGLADRSNAAEQRPDGAVGDAAVASRLLAVDRGGRCTPSVPARHLAGALLPQLDLHRDAVVAEEGGRPAGGADPPR